MKITIRPKVFETNSSMSHSLVVLTKSDYERWKNDSTLYIATLFDGKTIVIPFEEVEKLFLADYRKQYDDKEKEYDREKFLRYLSYEDVKTFEQFSEDEYNEFDRHEYTTPSGDELVICCSFGYDG